MTNLTMRRGPEPGRNYELLKNTIQIGRGARNDIIIIDNEVSREHCRLVRVDDTYELFDLESSNGTFVDGQRVKESRILPPVCLVELGDSITLEYRVNIADQETSTRQVTIAGEEMDELPLSYLVVAAHSQPLPAVYPLEGGTIDIGRGTTNNVIIVEPEISRNHLRLTRSRKGYLVQDLGSTNGTSLNGVMLKEPRLLNDGDVLRIGTTIVIRFTTNPQLYTGGKVTTAMLGEPDEIGEPTRTRKKPQATQMTTLFSDPGALINGGESGIPAGELNDQALLLYNRNDWETVVAPIADRLYTAGVPVWVEQYLTPGSEQWLAAIEQARTECWMLIVVVSQKALETDYLMRIWRYFHNREKPVVLVMQEEIERLPIGAARSYQVAYDVAQPEHGLRQLVTTIKQLN